MSYFRSSSLSHDSLVSSTVAGMSRQGMTRIKASHISGYVQPDPIGGYIPDATAYYQGSFCVAECESAGGLAQTHTADQWRAFFNYASRVGGYFIAGVNEADEAAARSLLRQIAGNSEHVRLWTF